MTLDDFIKKWDGKFVEAGGASAPNQCVDSVNQYLDELGLPKILHANAKDFPAKSDLPFIKNTPKGIPHKGDIIVWGGNKYGHVAIFIEGDVNRFKSLDQNYPTGSPVHIQSHSYKNVLGWLRPPTTPDPLTECLKQHKDLLDQLTKQGKKLEKFQKALIDTKVLLGYSNKQRDDLSQQLAESKKQGGKCQSDLRYANKEIASLKRKISKLEQEKPETNYRSLYENALAYDIRKYRKREIFLAWLRRWARMDVQERNNDKKKC